MVRLGDVERTAFPFAPLGHADGARPAAVPDALRGEPHDRVRPRREEPTSRRVPARSPFKGVTLNAAHSLRMENDVGDVWPGKLANFTILGDNPLTVDAAAIKDIPVWGTVHEGRVLPVARS